MVAQRGARPNHSEVLQQARRSQTNHWIRHRLSVKDPPSHRKSYCRITKMHEPHNTPRSQACPSPQGRISITSGKISVHDRSHKAQPCHESGTEVIGRKLQLAGTRRPEPRAELCCGQMFSACRESPLQPPVRQAAQPPSTGCLQPSASGTPPGRVSVDRPNG